MKKFAVLLFAVLFLTGCASNGGSDDVVEIGERFFVEQMEDIVLNSSRYVGRTIRYEGLFRTFHWPPTGETFYYVIRYTMGCCGEEPRGFELNPDGITPFPENAWVEVIGVLERLTDGDRSGTLMLRIISLTELEARGAEFV